MATEVQESFSVDNAEVSVLVSLPQLLDLALGTPEIGAVNFNILHNFLQILLHKINLQDTKVEYRGENAKRINSMLASLKPSSLRLQQHNITDGIGKMSRRAPETDAENDLKVNQDVNQQVYSGKDNEAETVISVEPVVDNSVPTASAFKQIEQSVKELQDQFQALKDLCTAPEAMVPLTDMSQIADINKRLEASEQGIDKLTTMLQDMVKDGVSVTAIADTSTYNERLNELENKVAKLERELNDIREIVGVPIENTLVVDNRVGIKQESEAVAEITVTDEATVPSPEKEETMEARETAADEIPQLPVNTEKPRMDGISDDVKQRLEVMEATYNKALNDIVERLDKLEKNVADLQEKVDKAEAKTDDINELVAKIREIETDMERLGQTADKLLEDKESREAHLNTLLKQIEILKTIKADREDLEDALADKADAQAVEKKVSHDQLDAACDDLTRGLVEAVDRLNKQESIWQQTLDEIQNEIANKVDRIEMTPFKDLVNTRLKLIQEKLKNIAEMERESEAAGTKKLLKDVQCISCNKDVMMKTEQICGFRLEPLPCTSSMKPYLTYELDQVRKQQKKLPHSRNMIQFEAAMHEIKRMKPAKEEMPAKTPRDHLCNRYCGGSHTVITPQQRILRTGHFLTQWGPEAIQLSDGLIRGKDGQMYRGQPLTCKQDICESMCWESQVNDEARRQISQERVPSAPETSRKPLTSQRNSVTPRKQNTRKISKELEITEPATEPTKEKEEEKKRVTSPVDTSEHFLTVPAGPQDIVIFETNAEQE